VKDKHKFVIESAARIEEDKFKQWAAVVQTIVNVDGELVDLQCRRWYLILPRLPRLAASLRGTAGDVWTLGLMC
jgi:hypothetical protein